MRDEGEGRLWKFCLCAGELGSDSGIGGFGFGWNVGEVGELGWESPVDLDVGDGVDSRWYL